MCPKTLSVGLVLIAALGACAQGDPGVSTPSNGRGAETALQAAEDVVVLLNTPDFAAASELVVPGHAALASLVEGATFAQVADALEGGDAGVAANFWAGFAQGAGSFLTAPSTLEAGRIVSEGNLEFHVVEVTLDDGSGRQLTARDEDGFRIDLFASFGGGLADKMIPPVERLINSQTEDAAIIMPALQTIVPSLLFVANQPEMSAQSVQDILRLVELITRVS